MLKLLFCCTSILLLACGQAPEEQEIIDTANEIYIEEIKDYRKSVSFDQGKYQINKEVIVNNENLFALIHQLKKLSFKNENVVSEIPEIALLFLDEISGARISFAELEEEWQLGCTGGVELKWKKTALQNENDSLNSIESIELFEKNLPRRQLIFIGRTDEFALLHYKLGGVGVSEKILIFQFDENQVIDFWCGTSLARLATKEEILDYLELIKKKEKSSMLYF